MDTLDSTWHISQNIVILLIVVLIILISLINIKMKILCESLYMIWNINFNSLLSSFI
jgi:hypothetical protein